MGVYRGKVLISGLGAGCMAFALILLGGFNVLLQGQEAPNSVTASSSQSSGVPNDWSHHHLIFSNPGTEADAIKGGYYPLWRRIVNNPRYRMQLKQQLAGKAESATTSAVAASPSLTSGTVAPAATAGRNPKVTTNRDWSFSLGNGSVAAGMWPAKYGFDTGSTVTSANCTSDYAVFGLNVAGAAGPSGQANLVGLDNLYSGTSPTGLCGTAPTVLFAYNVSSLTGGVVTTSPILSFDGTKIAFVESNGSMSDFHVLQWKTNDGTVATPATDLTSVGNITSCSVGSACMTTFNYSSSGTTLSSPWYVYDSSDTAYVGDDNGKLYQVVGVFSGAQTLGWSVQVAATGTKMTGPVVDDITGNIFIGGSDGKLYAVSSAGSVLGSIAVGSGGADGGGIVDSPTVDEDFETVMAYAAANAAGVGAVSANTTAVVVQADTNSPLGNVHVATVGQGSLNAANVNLMAGSFDNQWYSWFGGGPNTGHFYEIGTASNSSAPTLYQIPYSGVASVAMNSSGKGYTSVPAVSFVGSGSGATGTAYLGVSAYTIGTHTGTLVCNNKLSGAAFPKVTVSAPPLTGNPTTTATANGTYTLSNVTLGSTAGTSCTGNGNTYNITGGTGGPDTLKIAVASGALTGVTYTSHGATYTSAPTLPTFCTGTAPTFNWTFALNALSANVYGSGYSGTGSTATFTPSPTGTINVTPSYGVTSVAVTYGGGGYTQGSTTTTLAGGSPSATTTVTVNFGAVVTPGTPPTSVSVSSTAGLQASPINEILNGTTDLLFYGFGGTSTAAEVVSENVTSPTSITAETAPYSLATAYSDAQGGTSAMVIDNVSTQAQASSIYFTPLGQGSATQFTQVNLQSVTVGASSSTYTATIANGSGIANGDSVTILNVKCSGGSTPPCTNGSSSLQPNVISHTISNVLVGATTTFTYTSTSNTGGSYTFQSSTGTASWEATVPDGYFAIKLTQTGLQ